jgi:hypothetical protein
MLWPDSVSLINDIIFVIAALKGVYLIKWQASAKSAVPPSSGVVMLLRERGDWRQEC